MRTGGASLFIVVKIVFSWLAKLLLRPWASCKRFSTARCLSHKAARASIPPFCKGDSVPMCRPRCRDGMVIFSSRGRKPRTGRERGFKASSINSLWRAEPTLLQITPATFRSGSKVAKPLTTAATLSAAERTSTTRITGIPRVLAK